MPPNGMRDDGEVGSSLEDRTRILAENPGVVNTQAMSPDVLIPTEHGVEPTRHKVVRKQSASGLREIRVHDAPDLDGDPVRLADLARELLGVGLRHPEAASQLMGAAHLLLELASRKGSEPAVAAAGSVQIDQPSVPEKAVTYAP